MKKIILAALVLFGLVGCKPAVPTGAAAEASTDAIEITMDAPVVSTGAPTPQE